MKKSALIALIAVGLFSLWQAAFLVDEREQVIITQFGKPVGNAITDAGIHFKLPFIQVTHYFDKRYLEWDGDPNEVPTSDKRFIWIDTYARWRITDPLRFFQRLRDENGAQSRLDDILDGETRTAIAAHPLVEIVRSVNREYPAGEEIEADTGELNQDIEVGRLAISAEILKDAQERCDDLGIEVMDFRFKRIIYVREVQRKVFDRMISERQRIASRYRSEGQGEAFKIAGERERELKQIQSDAYRRAQEIIGRADAEATQIYARAYNQSSQSREFYAFLKTMETYLSTFDANSALILSTEGDFYRYLREGSR